MAREPRKSIKSLIENLDTGIEQINLKIEEKAISFDKSFINSMMSSRKKIENIISHLDPSKLSATIFDPGNPKTIGYFVALALTAQPRSELSALQPFDGSGVYAIYYRGEYPDYRLISGSDTPIYVGKAEPNNKQARTPIEQGQKLYTRLNRHRNTINAIGEFTKELNVKDFCYRRLVVQTGWEATAENYLIEVLRPIWNRQSKVIQGFGKHGDDPKKRKNKVSTWDVLHMGRTAAGHDLNPKQKTVEKIKEEISDHFKNTVIYRDHRQIFDKFMEDFFIQK